MLNFSLFNRLSEVAQTSFVLIAGIMLGAIVGYAMPATGEQLGSLADYTLLTLVGLLFFGVRLGALRQLGNTGVRFIAIALLANFIVIPLIGYAIASVFLSAHPLVMVGLMIYFMAPCTDWFLSFTRLSGGNVALGTALIPINMLVQLLLYPFYLQLFADQSVQIDAATIGDNLLQWFLIPFVIAVALHQLCRALLKENQFEWLLEKADQATLWVTALLVLQIFASNISVLMEHIAVFIWVLLAVFTFFLLTWRAGDLLSRLFKLGYPEHALLTMTIASRNAPMMLAITVAVLPDQPIIYSALVIGMLVEIPHLTALRRLLLKRREQLPEVDRSNTAPA